MKNNMQRLYNMEHKTFLPVIEAAHNASNNPVFLIGRLRQLADCIEQDMIDERDSIVLKSD